MKITNQTKAIAFQLLRTLCKYYIAYYMFSYAFAKILKTQFGFGPVYSADYNVSDYNGFMLTWYYFGYSRTYGLIIAACQILAGVLIIFRKTERIGIVLLLSFMVNIVLINIFYQIGPGAMQMSITLTVLGVFLLVSDWKGFQNYFFKALKENTPTVSKPIEISKKYFWLPLLIIPVLLYIRYDYINGYAEKYDKNNEFVGVWKVTQNSPSQNLFKLYFDNRNSIKIKDFDRKIYFGRYKLNDSLKKINYNVEHYTEVGAFRVQDSLNKLDLHKDSIKSYREKIINYYNKEMNVIDFKDKFDYTIQKDTLTLIDSLGRKQFFVNITKEYQSLDN
jgi:hypothetical protein